MRARISRARARVLWIVLRFSLESCIHESFQNSLHVALKMRALSVSPNESRNDVLPVKLAMIVSDRGSRARRPPLRRGLLAGLFRRLGLVLRPHSGQRQSDHDTNRHFEEAVERNDPGGV